MRHKFLTILTLSSIFALTGCNIGPNKPSIDSGHTEEDKNDNVEQLCKVVYMNQDGTKLSENTVKKGADSTYNGEIPTKSDDENYSYIFSGWLPSDKNIQSNPTVCVAQFSKVKKPTIPESGETNYDASVKFGNFSNGTLTISKAFGNTGDIVEVIPESASGYKISEIKVNNIKITPTNDGKYFFNLLKGTNTITAVFIEEDASVIPDSYKQVSIVDLAKDESNYYKNHRSNYMDAGVIIRGTVSYYDHKNIFLQGSKLIEGTNEREYGSIKVACTLSNVDPKFTTIGNVIEIYGTHGIYKKTFKITDAQGLSVPLRDNKYAPKLIHTALEASKKPEFVLQTFEINNEIDYENNKLAHIYSKMKFKDQFKVIDCVNAKNNSGTYLELESTSNNNFNVNVFLPYPYKPFKNNPNFNLSQKYEDIVFDDLNEFSDGIYSLEGFLIVRSSSTNNYEYNILPSEEQGLLLEYLTPESNIQFPVDKGTIRDEIVNISVGNSFGKLGEYIFNDLVKEFKKIEPNINVKLQRYGGYNNLLEETLEKINVGTHDDIIIGPTDFMAEFIDLNLATDIKPFIENDQYGLTDLNDFIPTYIQEGSNYQRYGQFSMPFYSNPEVMYYNADLLLNKSFNNINDGLPLTEDYFNNMTWEKLFNEFCPNIIDSLNLRDNYGKWGVLGCSSEKNLLKTLAAEQGIDLSYTNNAGNTEYKLDDPLIKSYISKIKQYIDLNYLQSRNSLRGEYPNTLFAEGKLLLSMQSINSAKYHYPSNDAADIRVCKLPTFEGKDHKTIPNTISAGILKHCKNDGTFDTNRQLASWLFYKFITNPENNAYWAASYNVTPVRYSSIEDPIFQDKLNQFKPEDISEEALTNRALKTGTNAIKDGDMIAEWKASNMNGYNKILDNVFNDVYKSNGTPEEINRIIDEAIMWLNDLKR